MVLLISLPVEGRPKKVAINATKADETELITLEALNFSTNDMEICNY